MLMQSDGKYRVSAEEGGTGQIEAASDLCQGPIKKTDNQCENLISCASNQYETDFSTITATEPCQNRLYYTRQRTCQCLTECISPAVEVLAPRTDTRTDGTYVGDRVCQCPDPSDQSILTATVPYLPNVSDHPPLCPRR